MIREAPALEVQHLSFTYKEGRGERPTTLYRDFSLSIEAGSIVAVMGPSGSGKSTFARALIGDLPVDPGVISWREDFRETYHVSYVDQSYDYTLHPWHRAWKNLDWPLRKRRWPRAERATRVEALLHAFGLTQLADSFPKQLSGGERQRVAVARCLSWKPRCLILDESLSALDSNTKRSIITALRSLATEDGMTVILITHILADTLALADRCILLGKRPVEILGDFEISLPHPRDEDSPEYREAQEPLIEVLRHGYL